MPCRISCPSEVGQASVEAAFILPIILLCIGLSIQPLLYMYTKSICLEACEEGVRYATSENNNAHVERFVRRRLRAVPPSELFHSEGEDDWDVEVVRSRSSVTVSVQGKMKPIPLLGLPSAIILPHEGKNLIIKVEAQGVVSPSWREGVYDEWVASFRKE